MCAALAVVLAVVHLVEVVVVRLRFHTAFLDGSGMRSTYHVPQATAWHADVQKHMVTPAGAGGTRRRHADDSPGAGWQFVGSVVLAVSTFKLVSTRGKQSRTLKKFRMHLSAAVNSPGLVREVHDSVAFVSQALAPNEESQLEASMPCTVPPQVIDLPSKQPWLFVQGMMQTARRPAVAPRFKAARNPGHRRGTARRAHVGRGISTAQRRGRRQVGSRLLTRLSPVCMRCTRFDPSTLRVQIQVGLRASRHMRTARSREAETPATSKDSCCKGTRSGCIQPKTTGTL